MPNQILYQDCIEASPILSHYLQETVSFILVWQEMQTFTLPTDLEYLNNDLANGL